uniref:Uncharacterized protein n=1 Tax=Sphaerodactylus townsendi TaxID=933632 RepID=A0ACB8FF42_9SAUR
MNFRRRRRLMELLSEKSRLMPESHDSPFCLRKQNHDNKKHTSFLSVSPSKEIKIISAVRRSSMSSCGSSGYFSSSPTLSSSPPVLCNPKSGHRMGHESSVSLKSQCTLYRVLLKRPVTAEELLMPSARYSRKTFTIIGDAVGWGFVVRGSKPCHVQAVDPSGPAAAAGMKVGTGQLFGSQFGENEQPFFVASATLQGWARYPMTEGEVRADEGVEVLFAWGAATAAPIHTSATGLDVCQFVVSVNGLNVLHADYRTVSNLILTGPRTIVMEVMEEIAP